jgi:hypothetical protein
MAPNLNGQTIPLTPHGDQGMSIVQPRVPDPHHFIWIWILLFTSPASDLAFHFIADPDLESAFQFIVDLDPAPHQSDGILGPLVLKGSILASRPPL